MAWSEDDNLDLDSLLVDLRQPDVQIRADAADALAELGDYEAVDSLIRSTLEDPDENVRQIARESLNELLGNEAESAIATYQQNPVTDDPWIQEFVPPKLTMISSADDYDEFEDYDVDLEEWTTGSLIEALRSNRPGTRTHAAQILGQRGDYKATEGLIRSTLEDPEEAVRQTARKALQALLGNQADMAIGTYQAGLKETDGWVQSGSGEPAESTKAEEEDEEDESEPLEDDAGFVDQKEEPAALQEQAGWEERDLVVLVSLLRGGGSPETRLRIIRRLKLFNDMRAVNAIGMTAVWDDNKAVRAAAREALEEWFGDKARNVLKSYRKEGMFVTEIVDALENGNKEEEDDDDDEYLDEEDEDEEGDEDESGETGGESAAAAFEVSPPIPQSNPHVIQPPVVQEEGINLLSVIMIGVAILVILALVLVMSGHLVF